MARSHAKLLAPVMPGDRFSRRFRDRWPDLSQVPAVVYVLRSVDGSVLYVGMSTNVRDRLTAHGAKGWHEVEIHACGSEGAAFVLEAQLIDQHQPPLNKRGVHA